MQPSKYLMSLPADKRAKLLAEHKRQGRRERNIRNEAAQGNFPEGLDLNSAGEWVAECRRCGSEYTVGYGVESFTQDMSYCARSDRCIP